MLGFDPGERTTTTDDNGWAEVTEYGLEVDIAVRSVGEAVAARADFLADASLHSIGGSAEIQALSGRPVSSRLEYQECVIAARRKIHQDLADAEERGANSPSAASELRELRRSTRLIRSTLDKEEQRLRRGESVWDQAESKIRSEAYLSALREVRDMGADIATVDIDTQRSHKTAIGRLKQALNYYPSDWIAQESESQRPLRVLSKRGRAGYTHRIRALQNGTVIDEWSRLTMGKGESPALSEGVTTAIHEYGHRMERLVPLVTQVEEAFLARRTGTPGKGRDRLVSLWKSVQLSRVPEDAYGSWGKKSPGAEWTRPNHFADSYIGREYNKNAFEVLTVGMEAVFGGGHGGLDGRGDWRADPEHKNLILGMLATL